MMKYIKGQFFAVLQRVVLSTVLSVLSVFSVQVMAAESNMATV